MRKPTLLILAIAFTLPVVAAYAQRRGDRGDTKVGRRGWEWQTGQDLEEEAMKRFQHDLDRLSDEEWKDQALAWIEFRTLEDGSGIEVIGSDRVADLDGDELEVEPLGSGASAERWNVGFAKKPPKQFGLILTDVNRTRIDCPLRQTVEKDGRALGIFQHAGTVLCMPRFEKEAS